MTSHPREFAVTRTGAFPIGFRRLDSAWQRDIGALTKWACENDFAAIDLGADEAAAEAVVRSGLWFGSLDLAVWQDMICRDKAARERAIAANIRQIETCARWGPVNYFVVMLPADASLPRRENFRFMVESFSALVPALESTASRIVIEGWPGPGALCCTPESLDAFFAECPSQALGINFDPSHLVRMGIDHVRFASEYPDRIFHVHAKDTEVMEESLYCCGNLLEPTLQEPIRFGGGHWRYALPGHGCVRWTEIFHILAENGYDGGVSIELEDANFCGTPEGEKAGLLFARSFLQGC